MIASKTPEEERLLERARAGDKEAFGELVRGPSDGLLRLATLMLDDSSAADAVQQGMALALERLPSFAGRSSFSTWLYGIVLNVCREWRRRGTRGRRALDRLMGTAAPVSGGRSVLSSILRRELAERMQISIQQLPPALREAFVLHEVERLPYRDVATITGDSVGALRVRAHRARVLLRSELGSVVDSAWLRARVGPG